ncbi:hypothetical protein QQS21_007047 [Conoideocrella luteorostrata]|uniref:DJ-1/PfpI domain-containing protein n=1 Tax=Conoideocrella luteorostrata TaxID=1105319 RepID=A0AAJ0FZT4_9HYPO|nr:hypothetical protein QQS21_007047 [Conoideocrella luteorostrata]
MWTRLLHSSRPLPCLGMRQLSFPIITARLSTLQSRPASSTKPLPKDCPVNYGVLLFPGFQALDAFGPLDALNFLSRRTHIKFSVIAPTLDPVSTTDPAAPHTIGQHVVPTHSLNRLPEDLEVLLVPGGLGTRQIQQTECLVECLRATYPRLKYLLTVCTGSSLAARAGILDGKKATSNVAEFKWVMSCGEKVDWVPSARWVTDGNIWTSSGVSAGMDMMYAFIADIYGSAVAADIALQSEYVRNLDSTNDPFAPLM